MILRLSRRGSPKDSKSGELVCNPGGNERVLDAYRSVRSATTNIKMLHANEWSQDSERCKVAITAKARWSLDVSHCPAEKMSCLEMDEHRMLGI